MLRKLAYVLCLFILFSSLLYSRFKLVDATNGYPVRNIDTGLYYPTIQEAINANETINGHAIFVEEGTYFEHLVVNKSVSLVGENRETTIIDGSGFGNVIKVTMNNVNISDFTIRKSGNRGGSWPPDSGISLSVVKNCNISGNNITNNEEGIFLYWSFNNSITRNSLASNFDGIQLESSSRNNMSENNVTGNWIGIDNFSSDNNSLTRNNLVNNFRGIWLFDSSNNVLRDNVMASNKYNFDVGGEVFSHFINDVDTSNTVNGEPILYLIGKENLVMDPPAYPSTGYLAIINSTSITVRDLNMNKNGQGVLLAYTNNSLIQNLTVMNNHLGIRLWSSSNNTLRENNVINNEAGISLGNSLNNRIYENYIANNDEGLFLFDSSYNKIFHNTFEENRYPATRLSLWGSFGNSWNDGYPSGGNYWSNYSGLDSYSGCYQNETGYDWIGDTPYADGSAYDNYPLMDPYVPERQETRVAHRNLLGKYNKLLSDLNSLNATYMTLLTDYVSLNLTYTELLRGYNLLLMNYGNLNYTYNALLLDFTELQLHQEAVINELSTIKNLMYIFVGMAIILISTTVYFAKRKPR